MTTEHTADPVQLFCAVQEPYCKPKLVQHTWIQITGGISTALDNFLTDPTEFMEEQQ
jgi:hypothetical protein